jgi:glycine cleavage system H protein
MSKIPPELKYATTHEWLRQETDGTVTVGISDHAQAALGDLVFVETPDPGRTVSAGEACAVVESVKAASDVYSPINGEIIAGNPALAAQPELLNSDPYGEGWIMRIRPAGEAETSALLDAKAYETSLED